MKTTLANAPTLSADVGGTAFRYREFGDSAAVPAIFLNHLTGVLDDWDPAVIDGFAAHRHVVVFDNRGVGSSAGTTPGSIAEMARDATAFIDAMGLTKVDLVGFSMGGFIAQLIAHDRPQLVRRVILAGTGPAGGQGINQVRRVLQGSIETSTADGRHPKHILFFSQTPDSQSAADEFLGRIATRRQDRDPNASRRLWKRI